MPYNFDSSAGPPEPTEILRAFGYLGHFLRTHTGGRGGKKFALISLAQAGGHLAQKDLFERSCTSSAAMSEVLSKLEGEGLITRTVSETDRRQLDVRLTESGKRRAQELSRERAAFESKALECLNDQELEELQRLCNKVCDHWKELEKEEVSV